MAHPSTPPDNSHLAQHIYAVTQNVWATFAERYNTPLDQDCFNAVVTHITTLPLESIHKITEDDLHNLVEALINQGKVTLTPNPDIQKVTVCKNGKGHDFGLVVGE